MSWTSNWFLEACFSCWVDWWSRGLSWLRGMSSISRETVCSR